MTVQNPKISFLTPTRERAEALKFSMDSLGLERNNIEVLMWVDDDDPQLKEYRKLFDEDEHIKLFVKPRVGYKQFHVMMNFLSSQATGEWLILWNDDAYMEGPEWYDTFIDYEYLSKPNKEPVVYNIWRSDKPQNLFPIISRKYLELVGHFAQDCVCDLWIKTVANGASIQRYIFGIKPRHRRFGGDDKLGDLLDNTHKYTMDLITQSSTLGSLGPTSIRGRANDEAKIVKWIRESKNRNLRVGFVGLGKLGLPVALAIESRGKNVVAYDMNPNIEKYIKEQKIPFNEDKAEKLMLSTKIEMVDSIEEVVKKCDLVFCAVQTPHDSKFEGDKRLKDKPIDFDYKYLKNAVKDITAAANKLDDKTTLVVISTCLPGTYDKEIKPLLSPKINYIYNPFFIAMGTVIADFLSPELVLIGNNDADTMPLTDFYKMILGADKTFITDITTAEGIKVLYNTFITTKIVFANTYGEMAHKLGMNAEDIYQALSLATDRIINPKYLRAGVGDGGGCHPRDNIALSYLAEKYNMSFNLFDSLMVAREKHMEWLAGMAKDHAESSGLPIIILGKSFKPETTLVTGSAAMLLANLLNDDGVEFSHLEFDYPPELPVAVYVIATQHGQYAKLGFPSGSIVIDPFRYINKRDGVNIISIGGS